MPNLNEGTLLYMPTTLPGISVTKAGNLNPQQRDITPVLRRPVEPAPESGH
jgi:Cu/Ag efflux pump CusA